MTHTYELSGLSCANCEAKVKSALLSLPDVSNAEVTRTTATITMNRHVNLAQLQEAVSQAGDYNIAPQDHSEVAEQTKSWFATYKPVLVVFIYITAVTTLVQIGQHHFDAMEWMRHFMAGFFLGFSFFKMLDLKGFAESYIMYDVIAKHINAWAFVYPFIELALGISYLVNFNPPLTNFSTVAVMGVSIIGVLQSVLNKRKIQCACLGAVFNLPMSTITIIEDALMIGMSGITLTILLFN